MNISVFCARVPLRTRAKRSAMGSVTVLIKSGSRLRGGLPGAVAKRHSHFAQERFGFLIRSCRGDDSNIKSDVALDFVELDFRKNRLIGNSKRVVAVIVKTARRYAAKIANARERCLNEALEKFIHVLTTQSYFGANRLVLSQFKIRDAFLGKRFHRALACNQSELRLCLLQRLLHVRLRANGSVNHHLLDLRDLVNIFIAVLLLQRRHDSLFIIAIKFVFHFRNELAFLFLFFRLRFRAFHRFPIPLDQLDVGNVNRAFALRDLAAWVVLRFSEVFLNNAHSFHQHPLLMRNHREDFPRGTSEIPRDHFDLVAFPHMTLDPVHKTSGASETIFIKLRSRNSRATGPKMRVPRGFKSLSIITIALLSKRKREPSSRRIGCLVRTRTARTTSPFFTVPVALASFTFAVITSPIPAN